MISGIDIRDMQDHYWIIEWFNPTVNDWYDMGYKFPRKEDAVSQLIRYQELFPQSEYRTRRIDQ